ncbi:MAG TPA: 1,4-dihydroxy-2-naphthoate polyprenyltransferase [Candidatus Limnocylindrales bacterium]|nr:1,4-dihydroxy-2-naphthoate polyprenyltransferase [Candidatus Limnocylindrales bacterium]
MEAVTGVAETPPDRGRVWLLALRVPTLAASVAPVLVGSAVAARQGFFRAGPALAALAGALLIQIGTNFANDLYDYRKGADHAGRVGPTRVLAAGWLSPGEVRLAMIASFALAAVAGVYLAAASGWPIMVVGAASIAAGIGYTAGRWALGYHGLGDAAVFLFFGVIAVAGTAYVQAGSISPLALAAALPVGALCTNILVVNNIRDFDADRKSGKRTLAVALGRGAARAEYAGMLALAYAVPLLLWLGGELSRAALLPLLTLPIGLALLRSVLTRTDGPSLNRALVSSARLHALFGLLFALGIVAP